MNPGRALWFALKVEDYDLAEFLLGENTDLRQSFEFTKNVYYSISSLIVLRASEARSRGVKSVHYQRLLGLLKKFLNLVEQSELRCHCTKNYEHRCPLYLALKTLKVTTEQQLFESKNEIVKLLLLKGATTKDTGQKILDCEGFRQYCYQRQNFETKTGFATTFGKQF